MFGIFYQYYAELYSHGSNEKKKLLKNMLSTDTRIFGAEVVERSGYLYTLFLVLHFLLLFWLNYKDVRMCYNEGHNVWSSNLMYYQPIFLQNNCICSDP